MYTSLENKENLSRDLWIEIDLDALASNIRTVKQMVGDSGVCAVIKADGYGHGAARITRTLLENGADMLAVATVDEALEIRARFSDVPILILGEVSPVLAVELAVEKIAVAVTSPEKLRAFSEALRDKNRVVRYYKSKRLVRKYEEDDFEQEGVGVQRAEKQFRVSEYDDNLAENFGTETSSESMPKLKVHIKVDTGMGRLGVLPGVRMANAFAELASLDNIEIEGVFSHFARADEEIDVLCCHSEGEIFDRKGGAEDRFSRIQAERFEHFVDLLAQRGINPRIVHMSNSAASLSMPQCYYSMVRVGALLFGISPAAEPLDSRFQPVLSLKSRAIFVKKLSYSTGISYGHTYHAEKGEIIVTVPAGYADGISRRLSGKMDVLIGGKRCRQVGSICMDYLMVKGYDGVQVGDEITIIGFENIREDSGSEQRNSAIDSAAGSCHCSESVERNDLPERIRVEELAEKMGSISYEVVCMLSKRIPRIYLGGTTP